MNVSLVFPMFAMVLLVVFVLVRLARLRIQAIRSGVVPARYFKTFTGDFEIPEPIVKAQNHFKNLFELPVLFYAACILAIVLRVQSKELIVFAWLFVLGRVAHAVIHLGSNKINPRIAAYSLGLISLVVMWILIMLESINRLASQM